MNKYLSILNARTALVLSITFLISYLTLEFDFNYNYDLSLISIAIIFPLVFTIRSAFRRREKALEYLSRFKAGLITVNNSFQRNDDLDDGKKKEIESILLSINTNLIDYLGPKLSTREKVLSEVDKVFHFIQSNKEYIGNGTALKILRFMKEVHDSTANIIAVNRHRTPIAIRAYCLIFIYMFPIIYTPSLHHKLHDGISFNEAWILCGLSAISAFILISLYNVQEQMENPFDQNGLDDIQLNDFRLQELKIFPINNEEKN